jgi:predicted kinase
MSKLILVRGLPGSGKSTFAKKIKEKNHFMYERLETDMFYETPNGYEFDADRIKDAHNWCYYSTMKALKGGMDVIVSNTFTTNWEMERYVALKEIFPNLNIIIINMYTQYETIHNVPEETMKKMKARWQDVDPSWDVTIYHQPEVEDIF